MGQKVNPHGLRVGVIKDWDSKWYAEADFADYLVEDYNIRTFLKKKLYAAGVSKIEIERASDRVKVIIYTAKPGVVIGKGGNEIEITKKELSKITDKKISVDIKEIKRPDKDAQLVADIYCGDLINYSYGVAEMIIPGYTTEQVIDICVQTANDDSISGELPAIAPDYVYWADAEVPEDFEAPMELDDYVELTKNGDYLNELVESDEYEAEVADDFSKNELELLQQSNDEDEKNFDYELTRDSNGNISVITDRGTGKRVRISEFNLGTRGNRGVQIIKEVKAKGVRNAKTFIIIYLK